VLTVTVTQVPGQPYEHLLQAGNHTIVSDVPASLKGGDKGPTPHELVLLALGACTAMTIEMKAASKKMNLTKVTVTVTEDQIDDPQQPGTKIPQITEDVKLEGTLTAADITTLKRAADFCPVYRLLTGKKAIVTNLTLSP
jgi:putative redox protein